MENKIVVVFGVFDCIHDGHLYFLNEAKKRGNKLFVIIARDKIVEKLKKHLPQNNESKRMGDLRNLSFVDKVFLGDEELGSYEVLKEINPNIICFGYDQKDLAFDLENKIKLGYLSQMDLVFLESYKPEIFHSSILNKK